jgi:regulator of protease activity HflC (stomatin/prohibitin superfamily)
MEKVLNRLGQLGFLFTAGGLVLSRFVFVVDGGERGVILDKTRGVLDKVYGEGMHFMVPIIQVSPFICLTFSDPNYFRD